MRQKLKRYMGILLSLVLMLGLMPGMNLTALAWNGNPYASLVNTTNVVHFDGKDWYLIEDNSTAIDAGTVTLLAEQCVAASKFDENSLCNTYSGSTVETAVNNYYTNSISTDAKTAVNGSGMFLLTIEQANALNTAVRICDQYPGSKWNCWWLCSPGKDDGVMAQVDGDDGIILDNGFVEEAYGVRPALKLDLSSVVFTSESKAFVPKSAKYSVSIIPGSNMTKTADSGNAAQTGVSVTGAMENVVYTADDGYYFPTYYYVAAVNGISVTRNSYTQITVSGTPTANATIRLSAPLPKEATSVTTIPIAKILTYTGQAQELVIAGEATGGTMYYAVTTENTAPADDLYTTSIPTATNAGDYYVWFKVLGDGAHFNIKPSCIVVIIKESSSEAPPPPSVIAPPPSDPGTTDSQITEQPLNLKLKGLKAIASGAKAIKLTWTKLKKNDQKKVGKFVIEISTDKKFTKDVITKTVSAKKNSVTIKKLKPGKKYYIRIRAIKEEGNIRYVTKWFKKNIKLAKK